jgi:hypothetical protein
MDNQIKILDCDVEIKIRTKLPTIKSMIAFQSVTRCQICGVLIGQPCYNEREAAACFPSKDEYLKASGQ